MNDPAHPGVIPPPKPARIGLWPRLRGYFFAGMLVTAPIAITVYVALLLISFVDERVFALIPPEYNPETYLPFSVPGIGVVLMIVILTLIGAIAAGYLGKIAAAPQRPAAQPHADRAQHLWRRQADRRDGGQQQIGRLPRGGADRIPAQGHLDRSAF